MMYFFRILLICTIITGMNTGEYHPVHISVVNLEYNEDRKSFEMMIRVFTDDFENAINHNFEENIKLDTGNFEENKKYIDKYIRKNLKIIFNKQLVSNNLKSDSVLFDKAENTTNIFYKFNSKIPRKVKVENTLFLSLYYNQKNLFIFTCDKSQEAIKFDKSKTYSEFILK